MLNIVLFGHLAIYRHKLITLHYPCSYPPSPLPRVRFRTLLPSTDCSRRCLSAWRAASSFSDSRAHRATAVAPSARDMSDPTDVASDPATDDDARRISARCRRREPCCRLVDVLRAALVRGTCGIGGKCERRGGMRDARGGGDGVGGRALLFLPPLLLRLLRERASEEEAPEAKGFGTPRMCTMPAPSCVSSSVQGFDVVDAADGARATAGAVCCQSYVVTLGRK